MEISNSFESILQKFTLLIKHLGNFNHSGSLPYVADIVMIMIYYWNSTRAFDRALDKLANFGKHNTIYTYAFVVLEEFRKKCRAWTFKVYLKLEKLNNILYNSGHVKKGIASKFKGKIEVINHIDNWQGTGKTFEYYRREL